MKTGEFFKVIKNKINSYADILVTARGITKRWFLNTFLVTICIVLILECVFCMTVRDYFYSSIEQGMLQRSQVTAKYFQTFTDESLDFLASAQAFVDEYEYKDKLELQVINPQGRIVVTSTSKFIPSQSQEMPDYTAALSSSGGMGQWNGKNIDGEHIMCITKMLPSSNGENAGAVRFLVSLEAADRQIFMLSACIFFCGITILFLMVVSSSYFINSIVRPVRTLGNTAKKIAEGDFSIRLEKKYDDEIGDLCDIFNYMADELALSEKIKNDFISSVSHELRTPLTAIKGWGETLADCGSEDKETLRRGLKVITRESERLSALVEELLDFSRMQSGRLSMMMAPIDVLAELSEAVYMFTDRARQENKELIYEEPEILPAVLGDMNRLKQVFVNIIDNAIKYTDSGDKIMVSAQLVENEIIIKVIDTGCGISAEDLPKIKEKFYKANLTRRGFGIGLAIADEIIGLHSGTLDIESTEGEGTSVTIMLPAIMKRNDEEEQDYRPDFERSNLVNGEEQG